MEQRINNTVNQQINSIMANMGNTFANGHPDAIMTITVEHHQIVEHIKPQMVNTSPIHSHAHIPYAEALKNAQIQPDAIRNVRLIGDDNQRKATMEQIRTDKLCIDLPIVSIATKGKQNITVKCQNSEAAEKFGNLMKKKYRDNIQIMKILPTHSAAYYI